MSSTATNADNLYLHDRIGPISKANMFQAPGYSITFFIRGGKKNINLPAGLPIQKSHTPFLLAPQARGNIARPRSPAEDGRIGMQ